MILYFATMKLNLSVFIENVRQAITSIRSQMLRAILTVSVIAIGIMALVGILTAIDVIRGSISDNFSRLGANTFSIRNRSTQLFFMNNGTKPKVFSAISLDEAQTFKDRYDHPGAVSLSFVASQTAQIQRNDEETDPNMQVYGVDENYLLTAGYEIEGGHFFIKQEIEDDRAFAVIGQDIVDLLFQEGEEPLGQTISVAKNKFRIIGILKEKGSSMGMGGDKVVLIPIQKARQLYSRANQSYSLAVIAPSSQEKESAIGYSTALMRAVRKQHPKEAEDSFVIQQSDNISQILISQLSGVIIASTIIGAITLFGASIGLMNIMLVSVTDRTREIGIRKAIGAKSSTIMKQFLIEAIIICQFGGLVGVILGIGIGNVLALSMGGNFMVPWGWVVLGFTISFAVGAIAGFYPAMKASRLDPIESLRHE